jgi:hypothetical protein
VSHRLGFAVEAARPRTVVALEVRLAGVRRAAEAAAALARLTAGADPGLARTQYIV